MATTKADVDQLVQAYLRKRGYKSAEAALKKDAGLSASSPVKTSASLDQFVFDSSLLDVDSTVIENILSCYNPAEANQPQLVEESYKRLKTWVDDSLDLYKSELQIALYPLFVHVYLDFISRGYTTEARQFFDLHKAEYADPYSNDIKALGAITEPHHVKENELASLFRENKYTIAMSSYAFELLVSFLQDSKFMTLLKYVNQYLNIKIYATKPLQTLTKDQQANIGLTGHTSQEIRSVNDQKIYTGKLLPEEQFFEMLEKRLKEEDDQAAPSTELLMKGGLPSSLSALFKDFKQEKFGEDAIPKDKSIPLPPKTTLDVLTEIEAVKDLRHRVKLSARMLPSSVMYTFHNTHESLNTLKFSKSSRMIAGGFSDSYIKIWSLTTEKLKCLKGSTELTAADFEQADDWQRGREPEGDMCKKLIGHAGPVYGLSFSADDKYLISGSEDGTARLWSTDTFSNLVAYRGHNYPIWDVDFSPCGVYFATASHDRTARLWSCEYIHPLRILVGHLSDVECVKFHPNSNYLVTASADKSARFWDLNRGRCVRVFAAGHPPSSTAILSVAISPDGKSLATGADDGTMVIWDIASSKVMKRYTRSQPSAQPGMGEGAVYSLDFSADGSVLASGTADGIVSFWDTKRMNERRTNHTPSMLDDDVYGRNLDLLATFRTKRTPVHTVQFTPRNLLLTAGPFRPY